MATQPGHRLDLKGLKCPLPALVSRVMTKFRKEELVDVLRSEWVIKNRLEFNRGALSS